MKNLKEIREIHTCTFRVPFVTYQNQVFQRGGKMTYKDFWLTAIKLQVASILQFRCVGRKKKFCFPSWILWTKFRKIVRQLLPIWVTYQSQVEQFWQMEYCLSLISDRRCSSTRSGHCRKFTVLFKSSSKHIS